MQLLRAQFHEILQGWGLKLKVCLIFNLSATCSNALPGTRVQGQLSSCATRCGDGRRVLMFEECDDANTLSGDGCRGGRETVSKTRSDRGTLRKGCCYFLMYFYVFLGVLLELVISCVPDQLAITTQLL